MAKKNLKPPKVDRSCIVVRSSDIHGKGVFVAKPIKKGTPIIEYKGKRISWKEAERIHPHDPKQPNHTFYFSLDDGRVMQTKAEMLLAGLITHVNPIAKPKKSAMPAKPGYLFLPSAH